MMGILARVFGGLSLLLATFLAIGLLLPGQWTSEGSVTVDAPTDSVYDVISRLESWPAWMPWPESGATFSGPATGAGASFRWSDPVYGSGSFVIVESLPSERIGYRVSVEDGAMVVHGRIDLLDAEGGTRIRWREDGEIGWNPLLAVSMITLRDQQEEQLRAILERLERHLGEAGSPPSG